jgi:hypothetical protein
MERGCLLHHCADRAVFLLRQTDGLDQCSFLYTHASNDMMDTNSCEDLRWSLGLIGLNPHPVSGNLLVVFLSEYGNDIESRASRKAHGNHLDWFRPRPTCCIVQDQIVSAPSAGDELALLPERLSEFHFRSNHESLLQNIGESLE